MLIANLQQTIHLLILTTQDRFLADNGNFMVSFTFDDIKFLLIYRHLQKIYWFKRGIVLLSIPRVEALALPIIVVPYNNVNKSLVHFFA